MAGNLTCRFGRVNGDADKLGTGQRQLFDLNSSGDGVRRVGVGHGLHHDWSVAAYLHRFAAPANNCGPRGPPKRCAYREWIAGRGKVLQCCSFFQGFKPIKHQPGVGHPAPFDGVKTGNKQ